MTTPNDALIWVAIDINDDHICTVPCPTRAEVMEWIDSQCDDVDARPETITVGRYRSESDHPLRHVEAMVARAVAAFEPDPNPTPIPGTLDELRAKYLARVELAKRLFEAQFEFIPTGRMPADPTWEELDDSTVNDFEDEARRAEHVFGPELDRLRGELHDHIDASVRSGERLMDTQEQRRALWEVAKGLARHLRSAKTALDDDSLLRMAEQTAERLRVDNTGLRFRAELAEGERDKANRQIQSLARRLHLRFQNEQRLESEVARLSSGDTPTPPDVTEQVARLLVEHQRFDIASCRCGWGRQPSHLGQRHSRHVADVFAAAGLLRAPAPQPGGIWVRCPECDVLNAHREGCFAPLPADEPTEERCFEKSPSNLGIFDCTLPPGHDGDHVAHGMAGETCASWPTPEREWTPEIGGQATVPATGCTEAGSVLRIVGDQSYVHFPSGYAGWFRSSDLRPAPPEVSR
ncbi:hypothetical protein [Amycolatopsis palatopharyngis]|uniref:hypothetical protein n=1 Tax=Amycolatopsis palatopharyngis TaxID=187982 RepID=UPI0013BE8B42|nr:hypothetical protein [Amycolatopsis palatopharyngis]